MVNRYTDPLDLTRSKAKPKKPPEPEDARRTGSLTERQAWMKDKQAAIKLNRLRAQAEHARTFIDRNRGRQCSTNQT